jgi:hypothetical protein
VARYIFKDAMTPRHKWANLPVAVQRLRIRATLPDLRDQARVLTNIQAVTNLHATRQKLFKRLKVRAA